MLRSWFLQARCVPPGLAPLLALSLLGACTGKQDDSNPMSAPDGLLDQGALGPFPNADLVVDGHLAIPDGVLPAAATPWDVSRVAWRTGFSPVQVSVARLWDLGQIDSASLSGQAGLGVGGTVRIIDLDDGTEIPCFAELDAFPDAVSEGRRALLVRPMSAMTVGHTVAVVVTDGVQTVDGAGFPHDAWDRAVSRLPHYADLADKLDGLGISGVALAWDFPIGDGTAPVRSLAASLPVPTTYTLDTVRTADTPEDGAVPQGTWKNGEGTFTSASWLVDDESFQLDADGLPVAQGDDDMYVFVHIPESARDAAPGTVPVVLFGHGILSSPERYLNDPDDPSGVVALSNRMNAIVIATVWRGLTYDDLLHAVMVSGDFGRFHELTDMLSQGVANTLALEKLIDEGTLLDDPLFEGRADRSQLYYHGISLGSIEGAVVLANQTRIDHAVLHVGGSAWSTMLERSSDWPAFEQGISRTVPDPSDRQILYSLMQLYWDPVDPISYSAELSTRNILWQESMGDNQVPNISTETLMRSVGGELVEPYVTLPYGIAGTTGTPTSGGPAFAQYDPELGYPAMENRPAEETGAHNAPRLWAGCAEQTAHALLNSGEVLHYCGDSACSAENTGE